MWLYSNNHKSLFLNTISILSLMATACGEVPASAELSSVHAARQAVEASKVEGIDLLVAHAELAAEQVAPGERVAVSMLAGNQGSVDAPESRVKYYLSSDAELGSDTYRNYDRVVALAPGESGAESANVRIPADWPEGLAYLLVVVDANDDAAESDETNNMLALPLTISSEPIVVVGDAPDLVVSATSLESVQVEAGDRLAITCEVKNVGPNPEV